MTPELLKHICSIQKASYSLFSWSLKKLMGPNLSLPILCINEAVENCVLYFLCDADV